MFKKRYLWGVVCLLAIFSFAMTGCGGGGGSSSSMPDDPPGTMPDPTPQPPDPGPSDEDLAMMQADAERVAGMIGPGVMLADADTTDAATEPETPIVSFNATNMPTFVGDDDGTDNNPDFENAMMDPTEIAGWEGATYTRTRGMVTDTVVKYNNKEAPGPQAFSTTAADGYYDTSGRPGVTGSHSSGVLTLTETVTDDTRALIVADFGITAAHQTIPFASDAEGHSVMGSFNGIPGTFSCAANTACPVVSDDMGMLASLTGWTFTPGDALDDEGTPLTGSDLTDALAALMVQGVVPDPDFMLFGYWIQATEESMGTTHAFLPFADGTMPYGGETGTVGTVVGSATYVGPATGLYMSKGVTRQGQPTHPFSSGQFMATATLDAVFGQTAGNTLIPNSTFTLSGRIENFMNADGEMIDAMWSVSLERTLIGAANTGTGGGDGTANTFSGATMGMNLAGDAGTYSGRFYGPSTAAADGSIPLPTSAAGIFDAHFTNGHVRGAFAVD